MAGNASATQRLTEAAAPTRPCVCVTVSGVGKQDTGILVLGATNTPWDLVSHDQQGLVAVRRSRRISLSAV